MAPPQDKVPETTSRSPLADIATAINTIAGSRAKQTTTTSPGDIAALQQSIAALQGIDYNAMLESMLQKAGAQIPNIQAAYGRAVGARSSGNAAYAAALQQLIKETAMAAQEKIAAQQLQNQQAQIQAGQAIAQATKGTTQTSTTKQGTDLQRAAGLLALFAGLKKMQGMDIGKEISSIFTTSGGGTGASVGGTAATPTVIPSPVAETPTAAPMAATAPADTRTMGLAQSLVTALTAPITAVTGFIDSLTSPSTNTTTGGSGNALVDFIQEKAFNGPPIDISYINRQPPVNMYELPPSPVNTDYFYSN